MRCVTRNEANTELDWVVSVSAVTYWRVFSGYVLLPMEMSNNLHVVIWCILLSVKKIQWAAKCRLCEKLGNLAFALSTNWLWINTFVGCINFRLFGFFSLIMPYGNNHLRLQSPVMSDRSNGVPATRHHQMPGRSWRAGKPCGDGKPAGPDVPPWKGGLNRMVEFNRASSDAGRRTAKRWTCALVRTEAWSPPWKGGWGDWDKRVRVFATANTWRTQRLRGASGFGTESQ